MNRYAIALSEMKQLKELGRLMLFSAIEHFCLCGSLSDASPPPSSCDAAAERKKDPPQAKREND